MREFIAKFSHCPLVWMYHSRTLNNKINKLRERALRLVYGNRQSTFEELLNKDKSATIPDMPQDISVPAGTLRG